MRVALHYTRHTACTRHSTWHTSCRMTRVTTPALLTLMQPLSQMFACKASALFTHAHCGTIAYFSHVRRLPCPHMLSASMNFHLCNICTDNSWSAGSHMQHLHHSHTPCFLRMFSHMQSLLTRVTPHNTCHIASHASRRITHITPHSARHAAS